MKLVFPKFFYTNQGKFIRGFFFKSKWNSLMWINGDPYRQRVETLIFTSDMKALYMFKMNNYYKVPGGCLEPRTSLKQQAINECKEEARILVKSIYNAGSYIETYTRNKSLEKIPVDPKGQFVTVFIAKFNRFYNKHVFTQLEDKDFINYGKFYPIEDVYPILKDGHRRIIDLLSE